MRPRARWWLPLARTSDGHYPTAHTEGRKTTHPNALSYALPWSYTSAMPTTPTRSVTLRIPVPLYDTLSTQAQATNTSVTSVIITRLAGPEGPEPAMVPAGPKPAPRPTGAAVAERDRRHLSPMVTPDRTDVRLGFTISEDECEHPRDQLKRLSYATTCKLCGKRML